jgi:hypothetical protein
MFGTQLKQWAVRVVGAIVIFTAYVEWKTLAESYDLENGVMGTYRPIALGLSYYLLWVFTRRIKGSSSKDTERPNEIALFAWFVCISIAAGFFAAQFAFVEAIDRPLDTTVAYTLGFIAFLVAAVTVLVGLIRSSEANIND